MTWRKLRKELRRFMEYSLAPLGIRLGMSPAGVGYAVQRGEDIAHKNGYQLIQ